MSELEIEDLFFEIGKAAMPVAIGARKPLREEIVAKGREWLLARRVEFCYCISSDAVQKLFKQKKSQHDQIRALIDVVASFKFGIPPMVVAKAIIILGESWFCGKTSGKS